MLRRAKTYDALQADFAWNIPARYNIGVDVCDRPAAARPDAPAILDLDANHNLTTYSFETLRRLSNRLANLFMAKGLTRGDRVAVLLPQALETAIAHIAVYKAGLIAVPLFILFGEDALEYRLRTSGAKALILVVPT